MLKIKAKALFFFFVKIAGILSKLVVVLLVHSKRIASIATKKNGLK